MKTLPTIKTLILGFCLLIGTTAVYGQDIKYIQLKERYIGGEIEVGYILEQPAYSIGFVAGQVQNTQIQMGLSLHFLINNLSRSVNNGTEELRKLNLLGLETQYYNSLTQSLYYYGTLGLHIGTAELNEITPSQVTTWSGFTGTFKPQAGLFYKINKRSEVYVSLKYMLGMVFNGTKSFQGAPLLSIGVKFREVGF